MHYITWKKCLYLRTWCVSAGWVIGIINVNPTINVFIIIFTSYRGKHCTILLLFVEEFDTWNYFLLYNIFQRVEPFWDLQQRNIFVDGTWSLNNAILSQNIWMDCKRQKRFDAFGWFIKQDAGEEKFKTREKRFQMHRPVSGAAGLSL